MVSINSIKDMYKRTQSSLPRGCSEMQFPGKLHDFLTFVELNGMDSIISWVTDAIFMIHDPINLVPILPIFFGQTKYRSFRRQLNMWHFERILEGEYKGGFKHPFFLKGKKALCAHMSRHLITPTANASMDSHSTIQKGSLRDNPHRFSAKTKKLLLDQASLQVLKGICIKNAMESSFRTPAIASNVASNHNDDGQFDGPQADNGLLSSALSAVESVLDIMDSKNGDEKMQPESFHDGDIVSFAGRQFHFVDCEPGQCELPASFLSNNLHSVSPANKTFDKPGGVHSDLQTFRMSLLERMKSLEQSKRI